MRSGLETALSLRMVPVGQYAGTTMRVPYAQTPLLVPWARLLMALVAEGSRAYGVRDWVLSYKVTS